MAEREWISAYLFARLNPTTPSVRSRVRALWSTLRSPPPSLLDLVRHPRPSTRPRPSLLARAPNPAATPPDSRQNRFLSSRINALRAKLKDKSPKSSQNSRFPNPNQQPAAGAIARWVANRRGRLHRRLWRFHRSSLFPSRRMDSAPGFQHHLRSPQRPLHHGGMSDINN